MTRLTRLAGISIAILPLTWGLVGCNGGDGAGTGGGGTSTTESGSGTGTTEKKEEKGESKGTEKASAPAEEGWGSIKGKIVLDGAAPKAETVVKKGDDTVKDAPRCGTVEVPSEKLVVGEGGAIKWAVVYLRSIDADKVHPDHKEAPKDAVELGQIYCQFTPHIVAMREGQSLKITSGDPAVAHNTNINGIGFAGFNQIVPGPAKDGEKSEIPGPDGLKAGKRPLQIACNVHPWMGAQLWVFGHPYYAVTGDDGTFEIKNLPAGKHQLMVWVEEHGWGAIGSKGMEITVKADGEADLGAIKFSGK